ncbi:unnamed protein product, partial [Rotaria magnacalcarata]
MNDRRLVGISLSSDLMNEPSMEVATLPPLVAPLFVMTVAGENKLLEQ